MKSKILVTSFSLLLFAGVNGCFSIPSDEYNNTSQSYSSQSVTDEYNTGDLNAYGEWIVVPEYGKVWRPYANNDWQPFAEGHWVYDGNEWVWDSYEPYGAIVYHYGNWEYVSNHRWIWIPNHDRWSPACVDWMYYGDQVAWAPRPPRGHSFGNPWDRHEYQAWVVIRNENFYDDHVYNHRVADATRDNVRYRDDQITRKAPPVTYVREHTRNPIPVTTGISRTGKLTPNRPTERNPQPATINTPTPTAPATVTPSTPRPTQNPIRNEPTRNNGGVTTTPTTPSTPTTRNPIIGNKAPEPTPVKPQQVTPTPVKSPVKSVRGTRRDTKRGTTQTTTQPKSGQTPVKSQKEDPGKVRQQPSETKPSGDREREERKPQSR